MTSTSGPHTYINVPDDFSEEEDDGIGARVGASLGMAVPPLFLDKSPIIASHKGSAATMTDDDSGLPSSTKTDRRNSTSDDTDTSDMEEKGAFDYFPTRVQRKREVVSIQHTYNPHYDEEIAVESDKSSVESPRSDTSSTREYDVTQPDFDDTGASIGENGTEMTTYSLKSHGYHDEDNDDNIHRKLYGRSVGSSARSDGWESIERPRAYSTSSINFSRSQPILNQGQTISSLRGSSRDSGMGRSVDDAVHFSSLAGRYPADRFSPPFPTDHTSTNTFLKTVGASVSKLVESNSYNLSQHSPGDGMTPDEKKKKKKKKDGKDDSGGHAGKPMTTDVNGNPLEPSVYRSMRGPPGSNESNTLISGRGSVSYSTANHDLSSGRDSLGMAKSEDGSSPGGAGSGPGDKRKGKKQRKTEVTHTAEEIGGLNYVGNIQNIDQLVSFINSDITEKTLKKIVKKDASPAAATTSPPVSAAKAVKKNKDRNKTKHLLTSGIGDAHDSSLPPASETQQALSLPADSSTTSTFLLSSVEGNLSPDRGNESRDGELSAGRDCEEPSGEMGNSSTSEKSAGDEDKTTVTSAESEAQSQPVFKNHQYVSEREVASAVSPPAKSELSKADNNKNHKNHTITRVDTAPRKEQPADSKDLKDKSKTNKNINKEGGKVSIPDNAGRKSKPKTLKNDVKSEGSLGISRSRSADSSRKMTVEHDKDAAQNEEIMRDAVMSPTSQVPKSPNNIDLASESGEYIFTDVDPPPMEQEFTVVSKKKKRSPLQASNYSQNNISSYGHHYSRDTQHQPSPQNFVPYMRNGPREFQQRPPPTKTRSCTPPPYSPSGVPETADKSRDLSPSAFPMLHKSTRTSSKAGGLSKDGRRRSLEELSLDTGLLGYDSDKESVKSLPAAQVRGAYPVSYASMVATPRPSVDSSKAESVCSSMEGGGSGEWQSPVVWKGRMGHERRHSIGSSPKDMAKATGGGNLQSARPRSGSQETLTRDATKDSPDKDAVVGLPGGKGMCQSDSANSFADNASAGSDADSARGGSEAGSEPSDVFVPTVAAPTVSAENRKAGAVIPGNKTNTIPGAVPNAPQTVASQGQASGGRTTTLATSTTTANAGTVKTKCQPPALGSRSQSIPATMATATVQPADSVNKASLSVAKPVNNGRKNKTSVIFLDKRFAEKPSNLDITFGFDMGDSPSLVVDEGMSNPSVKDVFVSGEIAVTAPVPTVSSVNVSSIADKSSSVSNTRPQLSQPAPSSKAPSSSPVPGNSDSNQLTRPPKGPHIAGLNGVVLPQRTKEKPAAADATPTTVRTPTVTASSANITLSQQGSESGGALTSAPISTTVGGSEPSASQTDKSPVEATAAAAAPQQRPLPEGCVAVKLGEGLSSMQGNGKSRQILCRVYKGLDTNGSFNLAEAASYFQRGWNEIEKQKEQDPAAVLVYNGE